MYPYFNTINFRLALYSNFNKIVRKLKSAINFFVKNKILKFINLLIGRGIIVLKIS